jgi:hypothetical protein
MTINVGLISVGVASENTEAALVDLEVRQTKTFSTSGIPNPR